MSDVVRWLAMGGYAAFVWAAYGIAAAVLGGVAFDSWLRYRQSERALARLQPPRGGRE